MDSFDIAQWADAHSQRDDGAKLFPAGQPELIRKCERPCCHLFLYSLAYLVKQPFLLSSSQDGVPASRRHLQCFLLLRRWNRASDDILEYGRAVFFSKMQTNKVSVTRTRSAASALPDTAFIYQLHASQPVG